MIYKASQLLVKFVDGNVAYLSACTVDTSMITVSSCGVKLLMLKKQC